VIAPTSATRAACAASAASPATFPVTARLILSICASPETAAAFGDRQPVAAAGRAEAADALAKLSAPLAARATILPRADNANRC
jgi:hypothetical protein